METNREQSMRLNRLGWPNSYYGSHPNWLVVPNIGQSRDSGVRERSNFIVACKALDELEERLAKRNDEVWAQQECIYLVERASHWAIGWVEHIAINPQCNEAIALAESLCKSLDDFPILDELHYSELEWNEASEFWESTIKRYVENELENELERAIDCLLARFPTLERCKEIDTSAIAQHCVNEAYADNMPSYESDDEGARFDIAAIVYELQRDSYYSEYCEAIVFSHIVTHNATRLFALDEFDARQLAELLNGIIWAIDSSKLNLAELHLLRNAESLVRSNSNWHSVDSEITLWNK